MKRVVTYDVTEGNEQSYYDFFEYAREGKAKQLTESTYLFPEVNNDDMFSRKIRSLFSAGDTVYIIGADGDDDDLFYRKIRG